MVYSPKMYFCSVTGLLIVMLSSCTLPSPTTGMKNLSKRARFVHFDEHGDEVLVGIRNPHPTCDQTYGKPNPIDCSFVTLQLLQRSPSDPRLFGIDSEESTTRREFKDRGITRRLRPISPEVDLPRFYTSGWYKLPLLIRLCSRSFGYILRTR